MVSKITVSFPGMVVLQPEQPHKNWTEGRSPLFLTGRWHARDGK
jgi:hypothetical protein